MNKQIILFAALAMLAIVTAAFLTLPTWAPCVWIAAAAAGTLDINIIRGKRHD